MILSSQLYTLNDHASRQLMLYHQGISHIRSTDQLLGTFISEGHATTTPWAAPLFHDMPSFIVAQNNNVIYTALSKPLTDRLALVLHKTKHPDVRYQSLTNLVTLFKDYPERHGMDLYIIPPPRAASKQSDFSQRWLDAGFTHQFVDKERMLVKKHQL